jgi:hypothetical protein
MASSTGILLPAALHDRNPHPFIIAENRLFASVYNVQVFRDGQSAFKSFNGKPKATAF